MLISLLLLPLNDVTTTYPLEPKFKVISGLRPGVDYSYSSDDYQKQKKHHPHIKPLVITKPAHEVFKQAAELARKQSGWEIINIDEQNLRIEAVSTTPIMQYKDDIVIEVRLPADTSDKCEIHMRSKSRVGKSDLGANADRIEKFLQSF